VSLLDDEEDIDGSEMSASRSEPLVMDLVGLLRFPLTFSSDGEFTNESARRDFLSFGTGA